MSIPSELLPQLIYLGRILLAGFCGGLVGYERQSRRKIVGIRTHVIIAVTACSMILLSKYGFNDVLNSYVNLDPSRVAAGVVTAVGFIGTGVIYFKNNSISGLTTSAGIWATVGIGMVIGAGMYFIGISTTVVVLLVELFLGRIGFLSRPNPVGQKLEVEYISSGDEDTVLPWILSQLSSQNCTRGKTTFYRKPERLIKLTILINTPPKFDAAAFIGALQANPDIQKISF